MTTVPVATHKRDWFTIIRTLMRYGVSMEHIGAVTGRKRNTVRAWQNGSEPKESDARIVLALLAKVAPEEYARLQAPFEIRRAVEVLQRPGDTPRLEFVEVK